MMSEEGNKDRKSNGEKGTVHEREQEHEDTTEAEMSSCLYTFYVVGRIIGRCLLIVCFPVIRCFGWDEFRHQHHLHHFV